MDQGRYDTHLSATDGDPRDREAGQVCIHEAVQVIRAQHDVDEISAYSILLDAAVEAGTSVRETAERMMGSSV